MRDLNWANPFGRRCKSHLSKNDSSDYYGRCELKPHDQFETPHTLERGMINVRWYAENWIEGG